MVTIAITAASLILGLVISQFLIGRMIASGIASLASSDTEGTHKDSQSILHELDGLISSAIERISGMNSLDELETLRPEAETARADLEKELVLLRQTEEQLAKLQESVKGRETKQAQLKAEREESRKLADEIKANQEQWIADYNRLEGDLNSSQEQLTVLSAEVNLTPEQQSAFNEITRMLASLTLQQQQIMESYQQCSQRFTTLETQYSDLEAEYKRLVEAELNRPEETPA